MLKDYCLFRRFFERVSAPILSIVITVLLEVDCLWHGVDDSSEYKQHGKISGSRIPFMKATQSRLSTHFMPWALTLQVAVLHSSASRFLVKMFSTLICPACIAEHQLSFWVWSRMANQWTSLRLKLFQEGQTSIPWHSPTLLMILDLKEKEQDQISYPFFVGII